MSRSPFDPRYENLPASLPIFPLPGALLLPGGRLPLNIFEPRYLNMVRDAIAGERLIGMIQPNQDSDDPGSAETYRTGCAGRIVAFSETEDHRYLITLAGLIRFDVASELPLEQGYRRVAPNYERFRDDLGEDTDDIDRESLLEALRAYFEVSGLDSDWSAVEKAPDESLVTSLAMACPFDPPEKQALLEAMTLSERAETLITILRMSVLESDQNMPRH
jgi:Lon protease-like protein